MLKGVTKIKVAKKYLPFLLLLPSVIVVGFFGVPFAIGVYFSLCKYNFIYTELRKFAGIYNYITIFRRGELWHFLYFTGLYAFLCVGIELLLGLAIALLLNKEVKGVRFFRVLIIIPLILPPILSSLIWKTMMAPDAGVINYLLEFVHLPQVVWLGSQKIVAYSLVLIDTWIYTPFVALILLAGLQSLPKGCYEAAEIDGASEWAMFKEITLPLLTPYLWVCVLFRGVQSLKMFDVIYVATKGGPGFTSTNLHIIAYYTMFRWNNVGLALGYTLLLVVIVWSFSRIVISHWLRSVKVKHGV
ncbi:Melibiose/raffinose/stachyose import permease protein MelD [subsurface metagenome]